MSMAPRLPCPQCGHKYTEPVIVDQYTTKFEGELITVPNATWSECPVCGERLYSMPELKRWKTFKRSKK